MDTFENSVVMYRSSSDYNVVCRDIWFRIKHNLGPFLVTLGPFWQVLRSLKFVIFVYILVAAVKNVKVLPKGKAYRAVLSPQPDSS